MSSTTSSSIISTLRSVFAQFGLPSVIVSDNGRNFTSCEFEHFLTRNSIKHLLSSPYHPSSNGLAERGVQIFKREISKLKEGTLSDRLAHILFYNHITPQSTTGLSPAELLQNQRLRSRLDLVKPDLQARIEKRQYRQSLSNSRECTFSSGDFIYIRNFGNGPKWVPGVIRSPRDSVSYEVALEDGRSFRRHVDHIRIRWNNTDTEPTSSAPVVLTDTVLQPLTESSLHFPCIITPDLSNRSDSSNCSDSSNHSSSSDRSDPSDHADPHKTPTASPVKSEHVPTPHVPRYPRRNRQPPDFYSPTDLRREKL